MGVVGWLRRTFALPSVRGRQPPPDGEIGLAVPPTSQFCDVERACQRPVARTPPGRRCLHAHERCFSSARRPAAPDIVLRKATEYELLDSAGKVLETTEDKINVGSGTGMTKVSNKISKAPAGAKKVRMKITKVTEDENSHDISVSNVKVTKDGHEGRWPLITGTFKAPEDIGPVGLSAVCHDSTGRVVVGNGLPTVTGAKSGDFRVKLGAAPEHWEPSSCFVGQTG
ncbi:hypothetical protein GCM10009763_00800 [Dermacoccus profundi]